MAATNQLRRAHKPEDIFKLAAEDRSHVMRGGQWISQATKLYLTNLDYPYVQALCSANAPNLRVLRIFSQDNLAIMRIPQGIFAGSVPAGLAELYLSHVAIQKHSPFLGVSCASLSTLELDGCGRIWDTQGQLCDALHDLPNLARLALGNSMPPTPSSRPNRTRLPHLLDLSFIAHPQAAISFLHCIEYRSNIIIDIELELRHGHMPHADLQTLGRILHGRYDRAPGSSAQALYVRLHEGTSYTQGNVGLVTEFFLAGRTPQSNLPRQSRLSFAHRDHVHPQDWHAMVACLATAFPLYRVGILCLKLDVYAPQFPCLQILNLSGDLRELYLEKQAAPCFVAQMGTQLAAFEPQLARLMTLTVEDCDLPNKAGANGSPNGVTIVRMLRSAFIERNFSGIQPSRRHLYIKGCDLHSHTLLLKDQPYTFPEYSDPRSPPIIWIMRPGSTQRQW
ncbi:hypothetical protein FA95DRAFT_1198086 [Auriscalpium vulgare]|uniref:Uncharacterized protein n=1 Tax=Auriscalpium vulgare TaxID=40419 RepID=A0ACB8RVU0_9AGAM|nr:hypothetical protein FA95DRAFT_1198086 [Auriscalpium vulgare]